MALSGCGHQLDTPPPSTANINPDLVCNQQLTKQIVLAGMNLTPLPTKTLGHEVLNLPTITLTESAGLDGSAAMGAPITIADDPNNPGASHVRWESEEQLGFDFTPDLNAAPGLYDVTVTNPDGKSSTLPGTLAVVPPPMIGAVMPPNICDAQGDQTVNVTGTGFLMVGTTAPTVDVLDASGMPIFSVMVTLTGCTPVPGDRMPALQECTGFSFVIPKGATMPGQYTLQVTNPPSAECHSTQSIPFVVEPPPHIDSVLPTHICVGGGTLDVKGTGFLPGAKVSLDDPTNMMSTAASNVAVSTDGTGANATFGALNATPGDTVDVTLQNADGCSDTLKGAVKVLPGPIIFYVDPPYTYGGITTPAIIYTTGITGPLPSSGAVVLTPTGATTPSYDLSAMARIDPNHPKHVIVDIPPSSTLPAGTYDLTLSDSSGCPAVYPKAITVVTQKTVLKDMIPPFGYDSADTSVTIDATASFFKAGARAYLAPHGGGSVVAIPLTAVVYQSATQLTAVVPGAVNKLTDGLYDLVTVNPDGTIGFLDSAFTIEPTQPPVITSISPAGVVRTVDNTVTISGENFATMAGSTPPPVTLDCLIGGTTMHMTITPTYVSGTATSVVIDIPANTFAVDGTVCVPTVNNSVGNSMYATGGSLAVFSGSFNINSVATGNPLVTARRAPAVASNGPTASARYLYAIGGDTGALDGNKLPSANLGTVEAARQDVFAGEGAWSVLPAQSDLPGSGITLAGVASVGRFIYLVGGYAAGSLSTVERAQVLDPAEAPQLDDADLTPDATNGLAPGLYYYRVAAVLRSGDLINPNGETLAGDEFAIRVPTFQNDKFQITLAWTGGPPNVDHWRIYRTSMPNAMPGTEDVVFTTAAASGGTTTFVDQGATLTPFVNGTPLPFGSLGTWAPQASLNVHRAGAAVTVLTDQTPGVNRAYLYAGFGYDSTNASFPTTYEVLTIDTASGAAIGNWSTPASITNGATADTGRWLAGAYAVTPDVDSNACPTTGACQVYVFFGAGAGTVASESAGAGAVGSSDVALVTQGATGGALTFGVAQAANKDYGYGAVTATNYLFALGGGSNGGTTAKLNADAVSKAATAVTTPTLGSSWGPNGTGQLPAARFLPGEAFGVPYFYTVGGTATIGGVAVPDTYYNLF